MQCVVVPGQAGYRESDAGTARLFFLPGFYFSIMANMKTFLSMALTCAMCTAFVTCQSIAGDPGKKDLELKVTKLMEQLSAGDFAARKSAAEELSKQGREALPLLEKYRDSDDPEIKLHISKILEKIESNPGLVPQSAFYFTTPASASKEDEKAFEGAMTKWRAGCDVAVSNEIARKSLSTDKDFAQSFVPRCGRITSVELQTSPGQVYTGWITVEVCADNKGKPSALILARCWLYADKTWPVEFAGFAVFDIPDIDVNPGRQYWLVVRNYQASDSTGRGTWSHLSMKNRYKEGTVYGFGTESMANWPDNDACFRIISKSSGPVPMMRKATDEEMKKLPEPRCVVPGKIVSGPEAENIQPAIGVLNSGTRPEE